MKKQLKSLVIALVVMAAAAPAMAQVQYDRGDKLFSVGLGIGGYNGDYYSYNGAYYRGNTYGVPITASLEFFVNDAISIGPYVGFTARNHSFAFDGGARGSYHFSKHIPLGTDKLDLYGAVLLGISNVWYEGNNGEDYTDFAPRFGATAGARWYFTRSFSANAEVGYGLTSVLAGISFKF